MVKSEEQLDTEFKQNLGCAAKLFVGFLFVVVLFRLALVAGGVARDLGY